MNDGFISTDDEKSTDERFVPPPPTGQKVVVENLDSRPSRLTPARANKQSMIFEILGQPDCVLLISLLKLRTLLVVCCSMSFKQACCFQKDCYYKVYISVTGTKQCSAKKRPVPRKPVRKTRAQLRKEREQQKKKKEQHSQRKSLGFLRKAT